MLYAKQFFASFFLVLGLGLIVIGIVGAGNTLMADWNPLGGNNGAGCVSMAVCDINCDWDDVGEVFTGACKDTEPDCNLCHCLDSKPGTGVIATCMFSQ